MFLFLVQLRLRITRSVLPLVLLCLRDPRSFHLGKVIIDEAVGLGLHRRVLALHVTEPLGLEVLLRPLQVSSAPVGGQQSRVEGVEHLADPVRLLLHGFTDGRVALIDARAHRAAHPLVNHLGLCIVGNVLGPGANVPRISGCPSARLGRRIDGRLEGDKLFRMERLCRVLRRNVPNGGPFLAFSAGRVLARPLESGQFPQRVDIFTEGDGGSLGRIWLRVGQTRLLLVELLEEQVDHLGLEDVLCVILGFAACRQGTAKVKAVAVLGFDPAPSIAFQLAARDEVVFDVVHLGTGPDRLDLACSLVKPVTVAITSLLISMKLRGDGVFINGGSRHQLLPLVLGRICPDAALVVRSHRIVCFLARHTFCIV
jgi:hypothetical protein